jgi:hypothetical protein
VTTWLDTVYGAEAALWATDALPGTQKARAGIRWMLQQAVAAAWQIGAGMVGAFLLGGLWAVLR